MVLTMQEFEFISWLQAQHVLTRPDIRVGPGDDAAVVMFAGKPLLVCKDLLTEEVDFRLVEAGEYAVGRKAMAVNLSDIAAMGGRPLWALLGIVAPPGTNLTELYRGAMECAAAHGAVIVGGDTNGWSSGLVLSVTVIGEPIREAVLRSGARPGDWLMLTGPVGGSIFGRHLNPTPRLREVVTLLDHVQPHAMIDISDGLGQDLSHLCTASGCGVVVEAERVPIHPDAVRLSNQTGRTPLDHALTDGEDFELLFAVRPGDGSALLEQQPIPLWHIGTFTTPDHGLLLCNEGTTAPLPRRGWQHRFGDGQ
jgi:thiamine-monophosphate kinase